MGRHESFDPSTSVLASIPTHGLARAENSVAAMLSGSLSQDDAPQAALPIEPDLAQACLAQAERLKRWDEDPDCLTEEEGDAEMVRWGAIFRRAIDEPSAGLTDLAAKARLMQDDMDRFLPADDYGADNYRLMRVILSEVVALAPGEKSPPERLGADAVDFAIGAHRAARAALTAACNSADEVWVAQNGGDASDEVMAPARQARDAASDAETDAWDALLETRPSDPDGLLRMLRYIASAEPMELLGDAREFGRNIAEAAEAALMPAEVSPALAVMVEGWRELVVEINAGGRTDEEIEALVEREDALQMAIYRFPAASVSDLRAKVPVFEDELHDAFGGLHEDFEPEDCLAGAAWLGLFRDFERLARPHGEPTAAPQAGVWEALASPDGTALSLLNALEECDRQRDALTEKDYDTPEDQALYEEHWRLRERIDALPVGSSQCMRAKARAASIALKWDVDASNEGPGSFMSLFKQVVDGVGGRLEPASALAPPLVDQIVATWREWAAQPDGDMSAEGEARYERLSARLNTLLDTAEALPATLENVPAKALAAAWIEYVALWSNGQPREEYGTDGRLALDIDTAITGRLKTTYLKGAA